MLGLREALEWTDGHVLILIRWKMRIGLKAKILLRIFFQTRETRMARESVRSSDANIKLSTSSRNLRQSLPSMGP
jgi:hypothetical protein